MNHTTPTRFPIRLDPVPGEAFDGWLSGFQAPRQLRRT
jgi:hypothetical protein